MGNFSITRDLVTDLAFDQSSDGDRSWLGTVKIQNLVNELHHNTARFLVDNFDVILLTAFRSSEVVIKAHRTIRSKTVRNLLNYAHHRFRNFLQHKAAETDRTVLMVNEAYTLKTVS